MHRANKYTSAPFSIAFDINILFLFNATFIPNLSLSLSLSISRSLAYHYIPKLFVPIPLHRKSFYYWVLFAFWLLISRYKLGCSQFSFCSRILVSSIPAKFRVSNYSWYGYLWHRFYPLYCLWQCDLELVKLKHCYW